MKKTEQPPSWSWKKWILIALVLLVVLNSLMIFLVRTLPGRELASRINRIPGLAGRLLEADRQHVSLVDVHFSPDENELFKALKAEFRLEEKADGRRHLSSLQLAGVQMSNLRDLLNFVNTHTYSPNFLTSTQVLASGVLKVGSEDSLPFSLRWTPANNRALELIFSKPDFSIIGEKSPGKKELRLRFSGTATPTFLQAFGVQIPLELILPEEFTVSGSATLNLDTLTLTTPLVVSGRFLTPASIQGGFCLINPGGHYSLQWSGPGKTWQVGFPEAELTSPFSAPLGELEVKGGEGSEWRFAVDSAPIIGELAGRFRLEGRYHAPSGDWEFRQAESSNHALKWKLSLTSGSLGCVWRAPRISGQGRSMHGQINWMFDFDQLNLRLEENRNDFSARSGRTSGRCQFDLSRPDDASFLFSGSVQTDRLEWLDPATAWGATRTDINFEISRNPGDTTLEYKLMPRASNVNIYGADLPKIKLENPTAELYLLQRPSDKNAYPEHIRGTLNVSRANVVESSFGSGELEQIQIDGMVALDERGRNTQHELHGNIEHGSMLLNGVALEGSTIRFENRFNRVEPRPGANYIMNFQGTGGILGVEGIRFSGGSFNGKISGEMRQDELLPPNWMVRLNFPSGGHFTDGGLAGSVSSLGGDIELDPQGIRSLDSEVHELKASSLASGSSWSIRIPSTKLKLARTENHLSGEMNAHKITFETESRSGKSWGFSGGELTLPVQFPHNSDANSGTIQVSEIRVPGNLLSNAKGAIRIKPTGWFFEGTSNSRFLPNDELQVRASVSRTLGGAWRLDGGLELPTTKLKSPIKFGEFFPVASGVELTGRVGGSASFRFTEEACRWNLALRPASAELAGANFQLSGLSGEIRIPGGNLGHEDSNGSVIFDKFSVKDFVLTRGEVNWLCPRTGALEIQNASGMLWDGQSRLATPLLWTADRPDPNFTLRLEDVDLEIATAPLGLPAGTILGRASGSASFQGGRTPELSSLELNSHDVRMLKFKLLEKYLIQRTDNDAHRQLVETLRHFKCRELRLRAVRTNGTLELELTVWGRPEPSEALASSKIAQPVETDTELELTACYRIPDPAKSEPPKAGE